MASDITKIKEMEEYIAKEKERFFSSIAHELRTPLNTIIPLIEKIKTLTTEP